MEDMKANELMIGDKVMVKVLSQIPDTHVLHTWTANDYSRDIQVKPIPLTSEILEKNGWIQSKYKTCKSLYEYKGLHLRHTMIKRSNGRWVANVDGIVEKFPDEYTHSFLRINVFYVHELQHALRLCGLTELADNLKV